MTLWSVNHPTIRVINTPTVSYTTPISVACTLFSVAMWSLGTIITGFNYLICSVFSARIILEYCSMLKFMCTHGIIIVVSHAATGF